ncbi:unnamed protein product [Phytophthora fragariaefolia]|uniref:Unnamed protein product n=1 Tax=Phytophthora fragariaefolia TaxID=1490495 RepID=A0A9W6YE63_9STRA|nr:unnamed protein product [Phytophthora fragariaefolia]
MLFHSRSNFQEPRSAFQEHWSPHTMAIHARLDGKEVYVLNLYAPTDKTAREAYYRHLTQFAIPAGSHLYVGGDFNCTQHETQDRTYGPTAAHRRSMALDHLITFWGVHDSLEAALPECGEADQLQWFHTAHHPHEYSIPGLATSRLDRWYVNGAARQWAADTQVDAWGLRSIHKGVMLHLRLPNDPVRVLKPQKVFPVPAYARDRVDAVVRRELQQFRASLQHDSPTAQGTAAAWDALKLRIVSGIYGPNGKRTAAVNAYTGKTQTTPFSSKMRNGKSYSGSPGGTACSGLSTADQTTGKGPHSPDSRCETGLDSHQGATFITVTRLECWKDHQTNL